MVCSCLLGPQLVLSQSGSSPLIKLTHESLPSPVNAGTLPVTFNKSANSPAPTGNVAPIYAAMGEDAFLFGPTVGNYYVESSAVIDGLRNLSELTITGWLNVSSLTTGSGGNRIISWINNGGDGVDLVYQSNGSLRLGVDGWPDNSPAVSSAGKVAADVLGASSNWVFFAVTYQSNGQVRFYFGNGSNDATLDVSRTYSGPGVTGSSIGKLAIGAFNDATRNSGTWNRMFRGVLDDIRVYGSALSTSDIVAVQHNSLGDTTPPSVPQSVQSTFASPGQIGLSWVPSTDNVGVVGYYIYNNGMLLASVGPVTSYTLTGLSPSTTYNITLRGRDAAGNLSAFTTNLVVDTPEIPSGAPIIYLHLNDIAGGTTTNVGAVGGQFTTGVGPGNTYLPGSSMETPPYLGGAQSADFGITPGNAFIESQNPIDQLKNMSAFTITGWLNCKSSVTGSGGNRIVSWINNGGDGVDLVYQSNGSLRLGIDGWPDNSPAFSNANKVSTNANAPESNWVFFAVTYQSNGQVQYYFGTNTVKATLDVTRQYAGPGVTGSNIGKLAIGAFNSATRNAGTYDRMFRGLIDNIQVFGSVLSLDDIVAVQGKNSTDVTPPTAPANLTATSKSVSTISLSWTPSTDDGAVYNYRLYNNGSVIAHIFAGYGPVNNYTLSGLSPGTLYNLSLKAEDAAGNFSSVSNVIAVTTDATGIPLPIVDAKFEETDGGAENEGTADFFFARSEGTPSASTLVPNVPNDLRSADFGTVPGDHYISSYLWVDELRNLGSFTLTGWLNNRSSTTGTGGNRIISWVNNGGNGVDLVYRSDGSLQLGVDEFAGNSPAISSTNMITTDANAGASNWVFFAVTYEANGQVQFYFGNNTTDATLDVTRNYPGRGVTGGDIGKLAFGAFNDATRSSATYQNMFRGLIDNFKIFDSALTLADIRSIQHGISSDTTPPSAPLNLVATENEGTSVRLSWTASTDNIGVVDYNIYNGTTLLHTAQGTYTENILVRNLVPGEDYQFNVRARDAGGNLSAQSNSVSVRAKILPLIYLPFDQYLGFQTHSNNGTLGGRFFGVANNISNDVPIGGGQFAITGAATARSYEELKNLSAFTITGWLNRTSNTTADRIVQWTPDGGGDGVELLVQTDGRLRLGVDGLAEASPAFSSAGKITTDATSSSANWVFFAVTYQANGQTRFYFGNNTTEAALDATINYSAPGVTGSNIADIFFRATTEGMIDEVRVFNSVLTLADIIDLQYGPEDNIAPTTPGTLTASDITTTSVKLRWSQLSIDNLGVMSYDIFNNNVFLKRYVQNIRYGEDPYATVITGLTPNTTYNFTVKARDNRDNYSPATNSVQVTTQVESPLPLVWLTLDEETGGAVWNEGSAAASFNRSAVLPLGSTNVPSGINSVRSADYGSAGANAYVESTAPIDALKNLNAFTITGWVNNRSNVMGSGGNRIVSWVNNGGEGVDLVYRNNGSLQLGVDGWPDGSPAFSSANKVPTNASAIESNWVFFAVTYTQSGAVQFYFGSNASPASLDVTRSYPGRGATGSNIAKLAIGNFNDATRNNHPAFDRVFRGLIDDIRIFGAVLTPQQILQVQNWTSTPAGGRLAMLPEPVIHDEFSDDALLSQNYPNPFGSVTNIEVNIPRSVKVARLAVTDLMGKSLQSIDIEGRGPTSVAISGDGMTSGVYIYTLITDGKVVGYKRMLISK